MPAQHFMRFFAILAINGLFLPLASTQDILVYRTQLGDPIVDGSGDLKYREETGWSSPDFDGATSKIAYNQQLSTTPWTVVYQSDRQNLGFTASANQLNLDLNGFNHTLVHNGGGDEGFFRVYDDAGNGSYLRLANGTVSLANSNSSIASIGWSGSPGRLFLNNAALIAKRVHVGGGSSASGEIILENNGRLLGVDSNSSLIIGQSANGKIHLLGDNSEVSFSGGLFIGGTSGTQLTVGQVILDNPTAVFRSGTPTKPSPIMRIANAIPRTGDQNIGLIIRSGRAEVYGNLELGTTGGSYGAILIEGGAMEVNGAIILEESLPYAVETSGGKIFLRGGEFALNDGKPSFTLPSSERNIYWDKGTFRLAASRVNLPRQTIERLTAAGATKYGGERRKGYLATDQILAVDGSFLLGHGIGLRGGTIRAGETIETVGPIIGYGVIDSTLIGTGTITSDNANRSLAIGALGGANGLDGVGAFRIGHLNRDTSYSGVAAGTGGITKVGTGTQHVTGSFLNTGGLDVQAGTLAFEGATARLETSSVTVAPDAHLQLSEGAVGTLTGNLFNEGTLSILENSHLSADGGILNNGSLTVNGQLAANISGAGRLGGTGTIEGVVDIMQGAVLAPGNSIGTLTIAELALAAGGQMELEIQSASGIPGLDWDLTVVNNLLSLSATVSDPFLIALKTLDLSGSPGILADFDPTQPYSWQFLQANISDPTQFSPDRFLVSTADFQTGSFGLGQFSVASDSGGLHIIYQPTSVATPESDAIWLLLGLFPILGWLHRSRISQQGLLTPA